MAILLQRQFLAQPREICKYENSLQRRLVVFWVFSELSPRHIPWTCLGLPCFIFIASLQFFFCLSYLIDIFIITFVSSLSPYLCLLIYFVHSPSATELPWVTPLTQMTSLGMWFPFPVMPKEGNQHGSLQNMPFWHSQLKTTKQQQVYAGKALCLSPICLEVVQKFMKVCVGVGSRRSPVKVTLLLQVTGKPTR